MKILSLDTSSKICSVAILEDNNLIVEKQINDEKTHSQKLMPLIDTILNENNLSLKDFDLLACCAGPGSFTGVRIGVSTVKAFNDVFNIPIASVSSLESLAYNTLGINYHGSLVCSVIDAKNDNIYYGIFKKIGDTFPQLKDLRAKNINEMLEDLAEFKSFPILFIGNGSKVHKNIIFENFPNAIFAEDKYDIQTSSSVGKAGFEHYKQGIVRRFKFYCSFIFKEISSRTSIGWWKVMFNITKMEIHTMRLSDLEEIKNNLESDFDNFWNYEIFKEELGNTNSSYLVLLYDDEIIGFGGIKIILDEANLMDIVIKKSMRNQGFAKFLLNELINISKEENCSSITLEVNENNIHAIKLYNNFNFKQVGKRKKYYKNGDSAILMTLKF